MEFIDKFVFIELNWIIEVLSNSKYKLITIFSSTIFKTLNIFPALINLTKDIDFI